MNNNTAINRLGTESNYTQQKPAKKGTDGFSHRLAKVDSDVINTHGQYSPVTKFSGKSKNNKTTKKEFCKNKI